jgi:hypothetical protein
MWQFVNSFCDILFRNFFGGPKRRLIKWTPGVEKCLAGGRGGQVEARGNPVAEEVGQDMLLKKMDDAEASFYKMSSPLGVNLAPTGEH